MRRVILLAAFALAACSGDPKPAPEPRIQVVEKDVPVAAPCIPDKSKVPDPPAAPSNAEMTAAAGAAARYGMLASFRVLWMQWWEAVGPTFDACRR